MNFEHLFYKKKQLCFLHSLRGCKNIVVSSVMEVFVRSEEYTGKHMTLQMLNRVTTKITLHTA